MDFSEALVPGLEAPRPVDVGGIVLVVLLMSELPLTCQGGGIVGLRAVTASLLACRDASMHVVPRAHQWIQESQSISKFTS